MKISVNRLKQIIKEELEKIAEDERQHEGKSCDAAHPGVGHSAWAAGQSLMEDEYSVTNEDLEAILEEDDLDYLEEEDLFEFEN
tara:strand:- start:54 stop:305 length:252 start_codon:yes stop_codon:yes gene_type:complete